MIELKTEHWYLMKPRVLSSPCYIRIHISSEQLPLEEDYDLNYEELGVKSIVPRFMKKSDFLNNVERIATLEEVTAEEELRHVRSRNNETSY